MIKLQKIMEKIKVLQEKKFKNIYLINNLKFMKQFNYFVKINKIIKKT